MAETAARKAALAQGSMRGKTDVLVEALTGHFEDHHAFLAWRMLARVDALTADIEGVTAQIEVVIAHFIHHVLRLTADRAIKKVREAARRAVNAHPQ